MKKNEHIKTDAKYFTRLDSGEWVFHCMPCITPFILLLKSQEQKDHMFTKWNEFQAPYVSSEEQKFSIWSSFIAEILITFLITLLFNLFTSSMIIFCMLFILIFWVRAELNFKKHFSKEITLYSQYSFMALKKNQACSFVSSVEVIYASAKFILALGILTLIGSQLLSNDSHYSIIRLIHPWKDIIFWSSSFAVVYGVIVIARLKQAFNIITD